MNDGKFLPEEVRAQEAAADIGETVDGGQQQDLQTRIVSRSPGLHASCLRYEFSKSLLVAKRYLHEHGVNIDVVLASDVG